MAGLFKQLASIAPAQGVCTRFDLAFQQQMRRTGSECYSSLVHAWYEALAPYEQSEPRLFALHHDNHFGEEICKFLAVLPDQLVAARCASKVLASLCYPAYAQVEQSKECWFVLFEVIGKAATSPGHLAQDFADSNPKSFSEVSVFGSEIFTTEDAQKWHHLLTAWATTQGVKW